MRPGFYPQTIRTGRGEDPAESAAAIDRSFPDPLGREAGHPPPASLTCLHKPEKEPAPPRIAAVTRTFRLAPDMLLDWESRPSERSSDDVELGLAHSRKRLEPAAAECAARSPEPGRYQ